MATKADRQRDAARRNTRMRFEQWANNPACQANTISAVRNVRMAAVAEAENLEPSFGQSPFAIARGNEFERSLFRNDGAPLLRELIHREVLPEGASGLVDLRLRSNGGRHLSSLDDAIAETKDLLKRVGDSTSPAKLRKLPALVASPTLRISQGVMLPEATLIIDALAIRTDGEKPELIVGEVKTYPDRGGHTDRHELAVARGQAGVYLHALERARGELGLDDAFVLSSHGFLVLTSPGSNFPVVRPREELQYQARRAQRGFALLEEAGHLLPSGVWAVDPAAPGEDLIDLVRNAETSYSEACLAFCDRAEGCFRAALNAGDPIVLGDEVRRFAGDITLGRIDELLNGDPAATEAETDFVRRVDESNNGAA